MQFCYCCIFPFHMSLWSTPIELFTMRGKRSLNSLWQLWYTMVIWLAGFSSWDLQHQLITGRLFWLIHFLGFNKYYKFLGFNKYFLFNSLVLEEKVWPNSVDCFTALYCPAWLVDCLLAESCVHSYPAICPGLSKTL